MRRFETREHFGQRGIICWCVLCINESCPGKVIVRALESYTRSRFGPNLTPTKSRRYKANRFAAKTRQSE
eukprot:4334410-Amphidinium_carterae.1